MSFGHGSGSPRWKPTGGGPWAWELKENLEFDLRRLLDSFGFGGVEVEELGRLEPEHPSNDIRRKAHERGVEIAYHVVVMLTRETDAVLRRRQLFLKPQEVLIRLQIGVGLRHSEQAFERACQKILRLGLLRHAFGAHGHVARLDNS